MVEMTNKEYQAALKTIGVSYLGNFSQTAKMVLNEKVGGVITYNIYLAPWKLAGFINGHEINVCPRGEHCALYCLNASGHNKAEILYRGIENSRINNARIKKTRLFYTDRELFMRIMIFEMKSAMRYAAKRDMEFSVRLNCTSDISPLAFKIEGKNVLELFPNVQFYDYTKVENRFNLVREYPNYNLTFSYDGFNWDNCALFLENGINVAVVFESDVVPVAYKGYPVIDMTKTDLRYKDPQGGFVGYLHYHRSANDYKSGKYIRPNTPFVVMEDDPYITYAFKAPTSRDME